MLAALAVLGACGAEPAPSATGPQLIALRTAAQPPQACMDALASGRLVPMAVTGLGLLAADGTVMAVEWPFGYTATVIDSDVV
ncbi:MAG TPA: hypothetical protein VH741_07370, partial [Candidatus Limnocylindrales bacterium]